MSAPFRPLDFLRTLREDEALESHEFAVLTALALGTDNQTFKVRRTQAQIALDSKVDRRTVKAVVEEREHTRRYIARVKRPHRRRIDVWLRQEPAPHAGHESSVDRLPASDFVPGGGRENRHPMRVQPTPHAGATGTPCRPSALTAPSASSPQTITGNGVTFAKVIVDCDDDDGQASKPCGCGPGWSCPKCRDEPPRASRHPEWRQRQWWEQNQRENEDPRAAGL